MTEHIAGRPVSASTYRNHGCRCPGCRAASSRAQADTRARLGLSASHRVYRIAAARSATWMRENAPDAWAELVEQAYADCGINHIPRGEGAA